MSETQEDLAKVVTRSRRRRFWPAMILLAVSVPGLAIACEYRWEEQVLDRKVSFRGIAVFDRNLVWVTGTEGAVYRTADGGETWEPVNIPEAASLDFRDVEILSPDVVLVMSAGEGDRSAIFRTEDAGRNWSRVSPPVRPETFYDGFAFWDTRQGILGGDPVDGALFFLVTDDGGKSWERVAPGSLPPLRENETGAFAASGSHLAVAGDSVWIGSVSPGGSRIAWSRDRGASWEIATTPMVHGSRTRGIFSIAFFDEETGVAVGGDYTQEGEVSENVILTRDGGRSWQLAHTFPVFQSAVRYLGRDRLISVGPVAGYRSDDGGRTWRTIPGDGYHTLDVSGDGAVWAAGPAGRIARLVAE